VVVCKGQPSIFNPNFAKKQSLRFAVFRKTNKKRDDFMSNGIHHTSKLINLGPGDYVEKYDGEEPSMLLVRHGRWVKIRDEWFGIEN